MDVDGVSIVARGITATGPEGIVFENVDARVYPGELAVIVGEGGTGRTSLLTSPPASEAISRSLAASRRNTSTS